jgi:flagellar protein FliO/FliZ
MSYDDYFRFLLALLFVLGLIGVMVFVGRRFNLTPKITSAKADRRLRIVEILPVDAKRRMILVRRDNVEHLVMLSTTNDVVIERNITAGKGESS